MTLVLTETLMNRLSSIPVTAEGAGDDRPGPGNALPLLHEIQHALTRFVETGERAVIDLSSIPFAPADEQRLLEALGHGEVEATINALGPTRVWETAFPGVWLVDHRNTESARLVLQVEVTDVPDILKAQPEDVADGVAALQERIAVLAQETGA
jgi:hydrogenase-1 operon protein HyaF